MCTPRHSHPVNTGNKELPRGPRSAQQQNIPTDMRLKVFAGHTRSRLN